MLTQKIKRHTVTVAIYGRTQRFKNCQIVKFYQFRMEMEACDGMFQLYRRRKNILNFLDIL